MKCLRCDNVELKRQLKGEGADTFEVDSCPACGGLWLDANEMARMDDNFFVDVEAIEYEPSVSDATDGLLGCPRCADTLLNKVHPAGFSTLVLDNCPACKGFWLDGGELDKLKDVSDQILIKSLLD